MSTFEETSQSIFRRFAESLAKVDLREAIAVPAVIGATAAFVGIGMQMQGQTDLLQHGGVAALDAYNRLQESLPIRQWLEQGLAGNLPAFGDNTEAKGAALMGAGPIISGAAVLLSRGFVKLREFMESAAEKLGQTPVAERIEPSEFAANNFEEPSHSPRG